MLQKKLTEEYKDGLLPHFPSLGGEVCIATENCLLNIVFFHLQEREDLLRLEVKPMMVTLPYSQCLSFSTGFFLFRRRVPTRKLPLVL